MTRELLHTEIKSKTNKYNLHKEKNLFTDSVNVYSGNCKRAQSLESDWKGEQGETDCKQGRGRRDKGCGGEGKRLKEGCG